MDRDRNKSREGNCDDESKPLITPGSAPVRPTPPCDPAITPATPTMRPPSSVQPPAPTLRRPDTIDIGNDEVVVTCADDYPGSEEGPPLPLGANAVVAAGTITAPFRIQTITGITAGKLDYIAGLQAADPAGILTTLAAGAATISSTFLLPLSVAQELFDAYTAVKDQVNASATAEALTLLSCAWPNEEVVVSCEIERPSDGDAVDGPTNPITVAAATYSSPVSQEDANRIARTAALLQLECSYLSDEVTVVCGDKDPNHADLNPGQPNEETGGTLGAETPSSPGPVWPGTPGRNRINQVTLTAGYISSAVSKAEANLLATSAALALLDCFYRNAGDPGGVSCDPACTGGSSGDWETGTGGSNVSIPAGIAASTVSWEAAAAAAASMVSSILTCVHVSDPVEVDCTDLEVDLEVYSQLAGGLITLVLNEDLSPTYTVSLPAGVVVFPCGPVDGQDQANDAARAIALAALECVYCSPAIPGRCPLPSTDTRPPIDASNYSVDRTLGVEADQVCGSTPYEVVSRLDSIGLTPLVPDPDPDPEAETCSYGNTDLVISCDGAGGTLSLTAWYGKLDVYNAWDQDTVTMVRDSYFANSLEAADNLAIQVAAVILNCRYSSTQEVCCPSNPCTRGDFRLRDSFGIPISGAPLPPKWRVIVEGGTGPEPPPAETFTDECDPETNPGEDPAETVTYQIVDVAPCNEATGESYIDLADAEANARAAALAELECSYTNYSRNSSSSCGGGQATASGDSYYISEGTYVSEWGSTASANMMAEQAIQAFSLCYPEIGASIGYAFGGVQGGTAKIGKVCGMDCETKSGKLIDYDPFEDALDNECCFVGKLTCENGEPKVEIVKLANQAEMDALVNSSAAVYVPIGCRKNDGVIRQDAFGMLQFDWCDDDLKSHPFKLLYRSTDQPPSWYVEPILSTIMDGTDGPLIPIAGLDLSRWGSTDVSVRVVLDGLAPLNCEVVLGKFPEIELDGEGGQYAAVLYVGRVEANPDGITFKFTQAIDTAQVLTHGFYQGIIVRKFATAPAQLPAA